MKKVVVDVFGGDHAPDEILKGCLLALQKHKELFLVLVGNRDIISEKLQGAEYDSSRTEIVDAKEVITNNEAPTLAIRQKKDSSLVVALERVKTDDECIGLVSAGSTGAVLTGATLRIGRIRGISRPALAPLLPTKKGGNVLLIDCGANVDCKPNMLCDFALMGQAYMKSICHIENPRVGLLSNGTEDKKGNELVHETFPLLKAMPSLNFIGNIEARDILMGEVDVVVTDGFAGNVALKSIEGAGLMLLSTIKKEVYGSISGKIGGLFLKKSFNNIKTLMDYNKKGGAPFLGCEKLVIKSHGSSKAESICGSIEQVLDMDTNGLVEHIREGIAAKTAQETAHE